MKKDSIPKYGIAHSQGRTRVAVNALFSRDMRRLLRCAYDVKTFTFAGAGQLRNAELPDGIEVIERRCFFCSELRRVEIPRSVTKIGDEAFCDCHSLKSLIFQEGSRLEVIGDSAFKNTKITKFVAPSSLVAIGQGAFSNCTQLKHAELNEGLEVLGSEKH